MKSRWPTGSFSAFWAMLVFAACSDGFALEVTVSEAACRIEGLARPLRQTVVLIDQSAIEPTSALNVGEANRRWIGKILAIAGVQEGQSGILSAPRERLTVVVAQEDGRDLIRVFTGCAPTFSQGEITEMKKSSSGWRGQFERFWGKDVESRIENDQKAYRSKLTAALAELPKRPAKKVMERQASPTDNSFLQALSMVAGAFDLSEGIPRIIVISPMNALVVQELSDLRSARSKGFDLAAKVGADLQRAEVYVTGLSRDAGRFAPDFARTFFLGLKGKLVAASGETLPQLAEPPQTVQVFSGFIDYAGINFPMQLRLATDRSGSLVNSWVEVAVKSPVATPLTGKAVCKGGNLENCEVKGDGKDFSQSWVMDIGPDPKFDEALPFSGLRYFEFVTSESGVKGRVYDPIVTLNKKKDLPFELSRTREIKF
jgi:hypothetical protein